jgi:branched-chain amino acid transport system substrate-binding protein
MMRSGAEMAIEDINKAGGIKALNGAKMELLIFDAGDSAEKAANAAQRMVAQNPDLVGGTGAWLSSFTLAVTEVTERAELPWLTLSYSDAITARGFRYIFQMAPTADSQAYKALPAFLDLAKQSTGKTVETIALVSDNTAAEVSFMKPIRATELQRYNLKAVTDDVYTPPLSDATAIVQRVRSGRPQIMLMLSSNLPDTKVLLDKFSEYNLGTDKLAKMGAGGHWGAPEMGQVIGPKILQGCMAMVANWGGKGQEDIARRFIERAKEPWLNQDAIMTYVDMTIFKEALERAGVADRRKVAEAIRSFDLRDEGPARFVPSRHLKFDEKGRLVDAELVIIQWQDGQPKAIFPKAMATVEPIWPKV